MTDPNFSSRLKAARKRCSYTQAQVATAIGVTTQAVSMWETGQSGASHQRIRELGQLLGVDWEWLGYGREFADPSVPVLRTIDEIGDFQKGPLCSRDQIAQWAMKCPELDIEIADAIDLTKNHRGDDIEVEWFEPRFAPTGIIVATWIETPSMIPEFHKWDVVVCDTGIVPAPGNHVLVHMLQSNDVIFRRLRIRMEVDGTPVKELVPANPDFPTIALRGQAIGRILATMVELRRYRGRSRAEEQWMLERASRPPSSED